MKTQKTESSSKTSLPFEIKEIPISDISSDQDFLFREGPLTVENLRDAIRHGGGQKMEIAVRPDPQGKYQPIYGFRRLLALKQEGIKTVLAKIYPNLSDEEALKLRFAENTGREDYSPYEMVMICKKLKEKYKYSDEEIGKIIGRNRVSVNRYLAISRHPRLLKKLEREEIGFKEAYQMATKAEEYEKIKSKAQTKGSQLQENSLQNLKPRIQEVKKVLKDSFPGVSISIRTSRTRSTPTLNIFGIGLDEINVFFQAGKDIFKTLTGDE